MATAYKHVANAGELSAVLKQLPRDMQTQILRDAVDHAIEPIKTAARFYARRSRRTGALAESIDKVTRSYPAGSTAVGMVGPTRDYFSGRTKLGKDDARRGAEQPSRRAHLIERGHFMVTGKKSGKRTVGWVQPKPFLGPAVQVAQAEVARRLYEGIDKGIERTRRRMVRTGAHKA